MEKLNEELKKVRKGNIIEQNSIVYQVAMFSFAIINAVSFCASNFSKHLSLTCVKKEGQEIHVTCSLAIPVGYSLATVSHSLATVSHSLTKVGHSLATISHSLATVSHSLGTVDCSLGRPQSGFSRPLTVQACCILLSFMYGF